MNTTMRRNIKGQMVAMCVGTMFLAMVLSGCSEEPALSLDDYLTELDCESFQGGEELATYGDMSAAMSQVIDRMSALAPPSEVADWHRASLTTFEKTKDAVDEFPKGDAIDFGELVAIFESLEADEADQAEIVSRMPDQVRQQMAEAGCIDSEDGPDDYSNDKDGATPVTVGSGIQGEIDYEGDTDYFSFTATEGQLYTVQVSLGTLRAAYIALEHSVQRDLGVVGRNSDPANPIITWKAREPGDYLIQLHGGSEIGSYTLTIHHITDDHGDDTNSATEIAIGETIEGTLEGRGDVDVFLFTGEAGHRYRLDMTSSAQYFRADVYESDPECLDGLCWIAGFDSSVAAGYKDGSDSSNTWYAEEQSDYYIQVELAPTDLEPGVSYTLTITAQ